MKYLFWFKVWALRILFLPFWIFLIWRRHKTVRVLTEQHQTYAFPTCPVCKGTKKLDPELSLTHWKANWDKTTPLGTCPECWIKSEPKPKVEPEVGTKYGLAIRDAFGNQIDYRAAQMRDEADGFVLYADFHITKTVVITSSHAYRQGELWEKHELLPHIPASKGDTVKMRHLLVPLMQPKPEKIKNPYLRRLQLMIANNPQCKNNTFPTNHYALLGDGELENLGKEVNATFQEWYPKALRTNEDGIIQVSYNPGSDLFIEIQTASSDWGSGAIYGPELVLELGSGELVTMFCGSKSLRKQVTNIERVAGKQYTLCPISIQFKSFEFFTTQFTPIKEPLLWMGEELVDLRDQRLWNIVQAIENETWANGSAVRFSPIMAEALLEEYSKREEWGCYSKKKVKKIKKANEKWKRENTLKPAYREY